MSIFVIGINHKTAPISVREKAYFPMDKLALYLQDLTNRHLAKEAVLLSTCNRSELYFHAEHVKPIAAWFCAQTTLTQNEFDSCAYIYQDETAVNHILQVACGIDSMVLGEPQILGQMKQAFSESCAAGTIEMLFHRLFQQVFAVAKEIRTTTAIGACPVSVASASVHFAKQQMSEFNQANVVLIGAGDTSELMMRYLKSYLAKPVTLVNRSYDKAVTLAEELGANVYRLNKLVSVLATADIVFSATGSVKPIINEKMMMDILKIRENRPIILIDIAMPRDIDPAVEKLPGVNLFCIDDLKTIIENNRQGREHAAMKAREMIRIKSREFISEVASLATVSHTIRAYRSQIEDICQAELVKAKQNLSQGAEAAQVLDSFAQAFVKKLLHVPSVQLRQAGVEGRLELLHYAKQLFAIPE